MINPLQHIPVVSSIYRAITGDEISPAARLAGGALFGGPIGLAGAYVSGVVEDAADTSIGEIVVAAFNGDDNDVQTEQLAAIAPAGGGIPASSQRTTENVLEPPSPIPPAIASLAASEGPPTPIVDPWQPPSCPYRPPSRKIKHRRFRSRAACLNLPRLPMPHRAPLPQNP